MHYCSRADAYFKAISLRDVEKSDDLLKNYVEDYGMSYVVKVENGKVIYPEDAEIFPGLTAADLEKGKT